MKNSERKPADRIAMRFGEGVEDHSRVDSFSRIGDLRLYAMTSEKDRINSGSDSSTAAIDRVSALPSTPSLSSRSSGTASAARGFPMELGPSRKKLLPASAPEVIAESKMVKCPTPGRTRFFRTEVFVAEADITRIRADSSALWPDAAQSLQVCHRELSLAIRIKRAHRS